MSDRLFNTLRLLAAGLVTLAGSGRIASLWFRELDEQAVLALVLGAVYLITGLGLFGQSRFTLFVAIALCAAVTASSLTALGQLLNLQGVTLALDSITLLLCLYLAWQLRSKADA